MAALTEQPEAGSGLDKEREADRAARQNPRVLLAAGALLTGLSIAIPSVMMAIAYPLNGSHQALTIAVLH